MPYKDRKIQNRYNLLRVRKIRERWLIENGPCRKCGSFDNLEVDHINPETKVSHRIWSWTKIKRLEELKKCQVLCKQCHKIKTFNWYMSKRIHGLANTYKNGCRCNLCREATLEYQRNFRKKKNEFQEKT